MRYSVAMKNFDAPHDDIATPSNDTPRRFIALFDIDGTLVGKRHADKLQAGIRALDLAGKHVLGAPRLTAQINFAGATDLSVARQMLRAAGHREDPDVIQRLLDTYAARIGDFVDDNPYVPLGDPEAAVRATERIGGIIGLGTGNLRHTAFVKLASAGIAHLFRPECGGYGDDAEDRAALLATGVSRCSPHETLPVVVIGDTPRDMTAALEIGALAIGVPHDAITPDMLNQSGAHAVVPHLDATLGPLIDSLLRRQTID